MPSQKQYEREQLKKRLAAIQGAKEKFEHATQSADDFVQATSVAWTATNTSNNIHFTVGGNVAIYQLPKEKKFECGAHQITYRAYSAGCPLCAAERDNQKLREALYEAKNKLDILTSENRRMKGDIDMVFSIQEACALLDDDDSEFLKLTLYQWRDKKAATLKVTHGMVGKKRVANGFIRMQRNKEPLGYACTSVGGMAIASYFEEAANAYGPAKAMEVLARGMAKMLPGSLG